MCNKWILNLGVLGVLLVAMQSLRAQDLNAGNLQELREMIASDVLSIEDAETFLRSQGIPDEKIAESLQDLQPSEKSRIYTKKAPGISHKEVPDIPLNKDLKAEVPTREDSLHRQIYGLSFFGSNTIQFSPSLDVPVPDDYILGVGDEIVITVWGQAEKEYLIVINREGVIQVPNIGPIRVRGISLQEAKRKIEKKFAAIYADIPLHASSEGTKLSVSIGKIRTIQVNVVGEVRAPGSYTMSSLGRLFHALYYAGGPNTQGSLRAVELIRDGRKVATLDVYQYLIGEVDKTQNPVLRDQDIVRIPVHLGRVQLIGNFKRPGYYELTPSTKMAELLHYAGGFTGEAYQAQVNVLRNVNGKRGIFTVKKDAYDTFVLQHGDKINAFVVVENYLNRVRISGAVLREGEYEWHENMSVSNLIGMAGGLQVGAFTDHVVLKRKLPDYSYESRSLNLGKILRKEEEDIRLENEDILIVPHTQDIQSKPYVLVLGAISNPGRYEYTKNMTLSELIIRAGGFLERANSSRIEIARRKTMREGHSSKNVLVSLGQFSVDQSNLSPLLPYDFIFVREDPNYDEQDFLLVSGEVAHPGLYPLYKEGERLSDIIERAGGITEKAFLAGASLDRVQRDTEYYINQRVFSDTLSASTYESILIDKGFTRRHTRTLLREDSLRRFMPEIKRFSVGAQLEKALRNPSGRYNITLMGGDRLYIPRALETVTMKEGLASPTSVVYQPGLSVRKYIKAAGGYRANADRKRLYIKYPSGIITSKKKFFLFSFMPKVEPGSEVYVPKKPIKIKASVAEVLALASSATTLLLLVFNTLQTLENN